MIAVADPSAERRQHDRVSRAVETLPDATGAIGLPWHVESMLARLERRGDISARERHAGEEFHRLFQLAHLDPLKSPDVRREGPRSQSDAPHGNDRARRRILAALDALGGQGSPCGTCAWFVLGCELSIRGWAMRQGWSSRPLSRDVAKGTLIGTLGVLAGHFGT